MMRTHQKLFTHVKSDPHLAWKTTERSHPKFSMHGLAVQRFVGMSDRPHSAHKK
ncbi:hypothetical protein LC593_27465 [Nostoc sp. CHAB 5844]|nr:hypothetical protein [Nostoc sp. CHAB 5844]